ncbi:hypothetical protein Tco_0248108 [Tanacetum coccineum]
MSNAPWSVETQPQTHPRGVLTKPRAPLWYDDEDDEGGVWRGIVMVEGSPELAGKDDRKRWGRRIVERDEGIYDFWV